MSDTSSAVDVWQTSEVVCPACRNAFDPRAEGIEVPDRETCELCGAEFTIEVTMSITYTTRLAAPAIATEVTWK